jgi:predicted nucleic acid-binding protein
VVRDPRWGPGRAGPGSTRVIGVDTSVIVRYLVGTPPGQAKQAADLIDDEGSVIGVSIVALAECARVLRTQYGVAGRDIIDSLIDFVQRENVRIVDANTDRLVSTLVSARSMPGRPIPDAMIVAALAAADAVPIATFDEDQARYGVATREP